ncbi:uncharacterized protein LOC128243717 [Mya arenaria]|uniref:uncharacterized protein LOC128243717 n=1 Tax=Mya arenaria TaxID=6604 RepID=UPI0022E64144|nr:uncharacterized protein LOC128243717 [Mya arenaria]
MPFCGLSSGWAKLTLLVVAAAAGLHCAALATPYWMKAATLSNSVNITVGLWKQVNCSRAIGPPWSPWSPCYGQPLADTYQTLLFKVTQILECVVLVPAACSLVLCAYYITSPTVRTQTVVGWLMAFTFSSTALNLSGCITWLLNLPNAHFAFWSLGLAASAAALFFLAGILIIPDFRSYDYRRLRNRRGRKERKEKEVTAQTK